MRLWQASLKGLPTAGAWAMVRPVSRRGSRSIGTALAIAAALAVSPGAAASVHTSGGIKYVTKSVHVKGGARATRVAMCPKHTHVLGGGERNALGYGSIVLNQTFPADSGDRGSRPDDGWKVRVRNQKSTKAALKVEAICGKTKVRYTQRRFVAHASAETGQVDGSCPTGTHAYSGGVGAARKSPIVLNSTFPSSPSATGATHWGAYVDNPSTTDDPNATLYAVCGKSTPHVVTLTANSIPPHTEAKLVPSCPPGRRAYGGGLSTSAGFGGLAINTLSPSPPTGAHGLAWKALFDMTTNLSLQTKVYAVCGRKLN